MNNKDFIVKQEYVTAMDGERYFVSTVCLNRGDFIYSNTLPYETMIFEAPVDGIDLFCDRYASRAEALSGHVRAVATINSILGLDTSGNI